MHIAQYFLHLPLTIFLFYHLLDDIDVTQYLTFTNIWNRKLVKCIYFTI